MKKVYLEIVSSVGAVSAFIFLIILVNYNNSPLIGYAAFGNVVILLLFVITVGLMGIKLANM